MTPKNDPTQAQTDPAKPAPRRKGEAGQDPWQRRGVEAVYFQREIMINFWTVMGGVAAGALLTQLGALEAGILSSRWYLVIYFIASILTIVNSWVQSAWGSLVIRWQLTVTGTLIYFLGLFSLCIQSLLVTRPGAWFWATGAIVFFAILNQVYFSRSGAWAPFTPESIRRFRVSLWLYGFYLLVTLLGAAWLTWYPSPLAEIIWGLVALGSCIQALVVQHKGMLQEKIELGIP
jgi:hypothetical protein